MIFLFIFSLYTISSCRSYDRHPECNGNIMCKPRNSVYRMADDSDNRKKFVILIISSEYTQKFCLYPWIIVEKQNQLRTSLSATNRIPRPRKRHREIIKRQSRSSQTLCVVNNSKRFPEKKKEIKEETNAREGKKHTCRKKKGRMKKRRRKWKEEKEENRIYYIYSYIVHNFFSILSYYF